MYGITKDKREIAKLKIKKTKEYLSKLLIDIDGEKKPIINFVSNSFINTHKYIAEINHRVHSINTYAKEKGLIPIFFTLTLPPEYHRRRRIKLKNGQVRYVRNDQYNPDLTPKDGVKHLSKLLQKFRSHRAYYSIDKDKRIYYRVIEPHKDGTPHTHVMFFVPKERKDRIIRALKNMFPEPQGRVVDDIQNATGYMMKYVLKTLDDLRQSEENLTDLTYWYIYHGICRLYTSRTLAPLEAYRRLNGFYSLLDLTQKYKSGYIKLWQDKEKRLIAITEDITDDQGFIIKENVDLWYKKNRAPIIDNQRRYEPIPKYKKREKRTIIPVDTPDGRYYLVGNKLIEKPKIPARMSNIELYNYYSTYDIENDSYAKFAVIHNEAVKRGLINEDTILLNEAVMIDQEYKRIIDEEQSIF